MNLLLLEAGEAKNDVTLDGVRGRHLLHVLKVQPGQQVRVGSRRWPARYGHRGIDRRRNGDPSLRVRDGRAARADGRPAAGPSAAESDAAVVGADRGHGRRPHHPDQCRARRAQLLRHARADVRVLPAAARRGLAAGARHAPAARVDPSSVQGAGRGRAGSVVPGGAASCRRPGRVNVRRRRSRASTPESASCWPSGPKAAGTRSRRRCSTRTASHPSAWARARCAPTPRASRCWPSCTVSIVRSVRLQADVRRPAEAGRYATSSLRSAQSTHPTGR